MSGTRASLPTLLQAAEFIPDREGSGDLWEFLNEEKPKITFRKGKKEIEFEKRYRRDFAGNIDPEMQPEKHIKFSDHSRTGPLESVVVFHTSQAIEPDDEFLKDFLGIIFEKSWDPDDDEEDDDEIIETETQDIPPAGRAMAASLPEVITAIGMEMVEQAAKGSQTITNNKTSKNGESKKRKYKKRKTKSSTKAKSGKRSSKEQGQQESTQAVRSNGIEEGRV